MAESLLIVFGALAAMSLVAATGFLWLKNRRLYRQLVQSHDDRKELDSFLIQFSHSLSSSDGLKASQDSICQYISEQIGAEAVAIYDYNQQELAAGGIFGPYTLIPSKNQKLLAHISNLHEAVKLCRFTPNDGSFVGEVASKMQFDAIGDGSNDLHFENVLNSEQLGGVLGQPLLMDNSLLGVIVLMNNRKNPGYPFDAIQIQRFQQMSAQIVLLHQLVRSYSELNRQERLDQELELARQIQFSLLPEAFPEWAQFSITAFTRPAKEVNGDFYDFVQIDDDRLLIVIGDACGKGIPASMLSAMTRSFIRAMADNFSTLGEFLLHLNNKLYDDTDDGRFVTLNCCLLDKKNSLLEFGRAGHTELITFVHNHLRVIFPEGAALGIMPSEYSNFDTFCLAFEQGMSFLVFSDGITEAVNSEGEEFGLERLKEIFAGSLQSGIDSKKIIDRILDSVKTFSPNQIDDQTLIMIQYM